jgi:vacuolar-type H+-ATPase subunit B/Vma2
MTPDEWWGKFRFLQYKASKGDITRLDAIRLESQLVDVYVGKKNYEELDAIFTEEYLVWRTKRRLLGDK